MVGSAANTKKVLSGGWTASWHCGTVLPGVPSSLACSHSQPLPCLQQSAEPYSAPPAPLLPPASQAAVCVGPRCAAARCRRRAGPQAPEERHPASAAVPTRGAPGSGEPSHHLCTFSPRCTGPRSDQAPGHATMVSPSFPRTAVPAHPAHTRPPGALPGSSPQFSFLLTASCCLNAGC